MQPLPPSALDRMAFLAGHWRGERGGIVIEEMWLAPAGGIAQGAVRLLNQNQVGTIELIIVSAENDRVVMRYNHFNSDYRTWEKDGPIALTMTKADDGEIVFSNTDQPARHASEVGYRRTSGDTMNSWVIAIDANGASTQHNFDYRRVS
jgi:hypothetical protein